MYADNSTTSLVLGICSIIPFVGAVIGILAIIFGNSTKKGIMAGDVPRSSSGKAQAGVVLGIVLGLVSLASTVGIVWAIVTADDDCYNKYGSERAACLRDGFYWRWP